MLARGEMSQESRGQSVKVSLASSCRPDVPAPAWLA